MGPCPRCGEPTEADANFCPTCGGYAAPATVYAYAPGRLEQSREEAPAPRLTSLSVSTNGTSEPATMAAAARLAALEVRYNSRRGGRRIALAATLAVVLIAAAAVGVVLATHRAVSSHPRASAPTATRTPSRAPTHAASPAPSAGLVSVAPSAAGSPYLAVVRPFLNNYFTAINQHDYAAYQVLFSSAIGESAAAFSAGYGTTTDSAIILEGVDVIGTGELVAHVSFVSHQLPDASPTSSSCNTWTISLYLLWQGGNYLLQSPPAGYQPSDGACS